MVPLLTLVLALVAGNEATPVVAPEILETRVVALTQTVTLRDIPKDAGSVRMWVPVPSDAPWQRVLDREVTAAPGKWKLVHEAEGRGDLVYVEFDRPASGEAAVAVRCVVERDGVSFPLEGVAAGRIQSALFDADLDPNAPLMEVTPEIRKRADAACKDEHDVAKQALLLMHLVADTVDHYSKDPTKPTCGRGAAADCLAHGGGCCSDLHSLFIALARARGIPARIQFGYRLLDAKAGPTAYDPSYRCWIEVFVPGAGWVPTDIVAADGAKEDVKTRWAALSATRVWLWQGRSFELSPPAKAGRIDTMLCGWAEIDGRPVDVLPAADGSPSKLTRKVQYEVVKTSRTPGTPKVAE
ncbi:MAG TPA: transglutaminase-like domain-containing protein [Planctomycetota bacterium]|nr:transglutaminase-like domain-containing protein [Planctomycetota bacterium]